MWVLTVFLNENVHATHFADSHMKAYDFQTAYEKAAKEEVADDEPLDLTFKLVEADVFDPLLIEFRKELRETYN